MELRENVIEWITGDDYASVTLTQKKYINRLRRIAKKSPDDVRILAENPDGSICAHISLACFRLAKYGSKTPATDGVTEEAETEVQNG